MREAMRILMGEHLALRGVARILKMDAVILGRGEDVDLAVLRDIVDYIETFPDRIHHPKEERYLFQAMRRRSPEAKPVLDRLFKEHQQENHMIAAFATALDAYARDGAAARAALAEIAETYAAFLEAHIVLENSEAFPLAETILTEADWDEIDAAFADNDDPFLGGPAKEKFAALHKRITGLGLPPMGLPRK